MANRLAGQHAKFSRGRALYYSSGEEDQRARAVRLMAEVLADAPRAGFSEKAVTQSEDVPDEVRRYPLLTKQSAAEAASDEDETAFLQGIVDTSDVTELGTGDEWVYASGYACASDRLVGSAKGDLVARIAAQISTATPDRPALRILVRTHDCRALERALHGVLSLEGRRVEGAGAEWFRVTGDELASFYERVVA